MTENSWTLKPKRVLQILLGIAVFLSVVSLVVWYVPRRFQISIGRMYELFFVDNENNFPTLFSVLLFLFCGLLLIYIGSINMAENGRFRSHWIVLAVGFFYLACDDFMLLHEKLTKPTNVFLRSLKLGGVVQFSWVIPVAILLSIAGVYFLPFLLHLPRRTKIIFVFAAVIFLSGAIGLETIGGSIKSVYGQYSREYMLETSFEEFLEMAGPIVFIYGLLKYIALKATKLSIFIHDEQSHISGTND